MADAADSLLDALCIVLEHMKQTTVLEPKSMRNALRGVWTSELRYGWVDSAFPPEACMVIYYLLLDLCQHLRIPKQPQMYLLPSYDDEGAWRGTYKLRFRL